MPKVSDTWKPIFSGLAAGNALLNGNFVDAGLNLTLALGQAGYAKGKNYLKDADLGDFFGPRQGPGKYGLPGSPGLAGDETGQSLKAAFGVEAVILERGLQMVTAMTLLCGAGGEKGQTYTAASNYFELAWENLKDAALEGESWTGASADAYDARNAQQQEWALAMQAIDLQVADLLAQNSDMLGNCKVALTSVRAFFTVCIPIAITLRWAYGPAGPQISRKFQWAMFLTGMAVATGALGFAGYQAYENGQALAPLTVEYEAVAQSAQVTGTDGVSAKVAPAPKSKTGTFDEIGGADSATAATGSVASQPGALAAGTPSPAGATEATGSQADSPSDRALPQPGAGPSFTAPAASQTSGGASTSPAPPAAYAKTAPNRPAPAAEGDIDAGEPDGAAADAEVGERAPVDVVGAAAEQAQERVL
jgi:hypothetical protein